MTAASGPFQLVADIGGTNARCARAQRSADGIVLQGLQQYATADFSSLEQALRHFLGGERPQRAVLALACAITGDRLKITNNPWAFSLSELAAQLGCPVAAINDFAAVSIALPALGADDVLAIGSAVPVRVPAARRCYAVVGPGTGLGVGGLVLESGRRTVIESEGGHLAFAPADAYEAAVLAALWPRFGRVSAERLLSGPGLVNLHEAMCTVDGLPLEPLRAQDITARAAAQADGSCARVVALACGLLGSFAGDIALAFGAWDGVFLHGGVAQQLRPWLLQGAFRQRFENKGRHAPIMQAIPTRLIVHPQAGLLGAALHGASLD